MGDAESNAQHSKKRAAGVQLSRDNPGLDNEETLEHESGTFKRASDEVLATRRIVKVRRPQASSTSVAPTNSAPSNPFAAIRLVPTAPVSPQAPVAEENGVKENKETTDSFPVEEPKVVSVAGTEKTETSEVNTKRSEITEASPEGGLNVPKDETDNVSKLASSNSVEEVSVNKELLDGSRESTDADNTRNEAKGTTDDGKSENGQAKEGSSAEKSKENTTFSSFGQLSSTQNAFSGLSGSGFSSTSFSFGSIPKDGSSGIFNFGSSNNEDSSNHSAARKPLSIIGSSNISPLQEVPVETGEENEKAIFAADSALYEFADGAWKERGKGELKLNVSTVGTPKARLVMRTKGNFRLILNASLFPEMNLKSMDKRGISFACVNSSNEGKDCLSTFALKFKDASIVESFQSAVAEHKDKISVAPKTPEHSPKASDE